MRSLSPRARPRIGQSCCAARRSPSITAFSLVELALAIAVVAIGFVGLLGLLPGGLSNFRQAMNLSVCAQIAQRMASEAQETDFATLFASAKVKRAGELGQYFLLPPRYFDDQGNETAAPESATATERARIIYTVRIRGSYPAPENDPRYFTALPAGETPYVSRDLTILTIQVLNDPAARDLTSFADAKSLLIDERKARAAALPVQTFSVALARNGGPPPRF